MLGSVTGLFAQPNLSFRIGGSAVAVDQRGEGNKIFEAAVPSVPTLGVKLGFEKFPRFGVGSSVELLNLCRYTDAGHLSNIYNVYGFYDRPLVKTDLLTFQYTLELGTGFSRGVWDPVSNPGNQLVGSMITARVGLGLELLFDMPGNDELGFGLYYNHNSNGSTRLPNRGYNGIELAANYKFSCGSKGSPSQVEFRNPNGTEVATGSLNVDVYASGSASALWNEHLVENCKNCPVYPRFAFGADVIYRYSARSGAGAGVDLFYTPQRVSDRLEELNAIVYPSEDGNDDEYQPLSFGFCAIHESWYRNLSLRIGVGLYAYNHDGFSIYRRSYQSLALRYHMPAVGNTFVGIGLKVHRFTMADCIQFMVGKRF